MKIIENRKIPFTISTILTVVSFVLLLTLGLKPGIDFTGGTLMELTFMQERPSLAEMQQTMDGLDFGSVRVQPTDEDGYLLKMRFISEEEHQTVLSTVRDRFAPAKPAEISVGTVESDGGTLLIDAQTGEQTVVAPGSDKARALDIALGSSPDIVEERIETIGPAISSELRSRSIQAGIGVVGAIILFVAYSFRRVSKPVSSWKFGVTAIIALIHDVAITMGVFTLLGHFYGVEIGIPFVVAMLTILGYSVNDTIVVFDRVREKLLKRGNSRFAETVDIGVNETIPRSVNTSITTLLVLTALFLFGGDSIHFFSLALIVGIILGTYSSIFLASPLLVEWEKLKNRS
jgi:preprotein translocase subunit SecF